MIGFILAASLVAQPQASEVEHARAEIYAQYDLQEKSYRKCLEDAVIELDDHISDAGTIVESLQTRCELPRSIFIDIVKSRISFEAREAGQHKSENDLSVEGWDRVQDITKGWRQELVANILEARVTKK